MNCIKDDRLNCHSVMVNLPIDRYLSFVNKALESNGGITGQRGALTTKSARQIREHMKEDFKKGAVLPPVVIGIIDGNFIEKNDTEFDKYLDGIDEENISIIDGMQRTAAMKEANLNKDEQTGRKIRVEFWIVKNINDLIYRMLVLNTGQIPWNTRRQLEVVFNPIKKVIGDKIPNLKLIDINDSERRSQAGEFQSNKIIELFQVFTTRSEKFDTKEVLSDNFQRLEMIEATSKEKTFDMFIEILKNLVEFDKNLSICTKGQEETGKFKEGKDIFTSQPALVGFMTAISQRILGRPGDDYDEQSVEKKYNEIIDAFKKFNDSINKKSNEEMCEFLELELLNERMNNLKGTRVGDIERDFFVSAFRVMVDDRFNISQMSSCWRSA